MPDIPGNRTLYAGPREFNHYFLLAVLVYLVAGCSKEAPSLAQLQADETALIRATVADPARIERLLELLKERDRLVAEITTMLSRYRQELKEINADYNAGRENYVTKIDQYNRARAQKQRRYIELVANMKAATNPDEWNVIAEFQLDNVNARQLIYSRATGGS